MDELVSFITIRKDSKLKAITQNKQFTLNKISFTIRKKCFQMHMI